MDSGVIAISDGDACCKRTQHQPQEQHHSFTVKLYGSYATLAEVQGDWLCCPSTQYAL